MLNIINKTNFQLPDYIEGDLRELCHKAGIVPIKVCLIIKKRNRYVGDCWIKKSKTPIAPNGVYKMDYETVIIRITRQTVREDFRFVLAHELGHLKQHLETRHRLNWLKKGYPTEAYANKFAIQECHCYPKAGYRIKHFLPKEVKQ